jgi:hypothetical protein
MVNNVILDLRFGGDTHHKKREIRIHSVQVCTRGMIPIAKNIIVIDWQGNEYEATYPKRAKGLVKNGRARFVDEHTICLACPPNIILEDNYMSDNMINEKTEAASNPMTPTLDYILSRIDQIINDNK